MKKIFGQVRQKYADQFEFDQISKILGMEKSALVPQEEVSTATVPPTCITNNWEMFRV